VSDLAVVVAVVGPVDDGVEGAPVKVLAPPPFRVTVKLWPKMGETEDEDAVNATVEVVCLIVDADCPETVEAELDTASVVFPEPGNELE